MRRMLDNRFMQHMTMECRVCTARHLLCTTGHYTFTLGCWKWPFRGSEVASQEWCRRAFEFQFCSGATY